MEPALAVTRAIDELNRRIGIVAIYLVLFAALVSAFNAIFRYSTNGIIWLERTCRRRRLRRHPRLSTARTPTRSRKRNGTCSPAWSCSAAPGRSRSTSMSASTSSTASVSERTRTWIDLLGGIFFLLPMCALMIYFTWPWFMQAWITNEGSANAGGLVRWPVKLMLPLGFALVGAAGHFRDHQMRPGADARLCPRIRLREAAAMIDLLDPLHGPADVRGADRLHGDRLSRRRSRSRRSGCSSASSPSSSG